MARRSEFYKGRKKKRNYAIVPLIILMILIGMLMVLFYSMQKYAVISEDKISIELPILKDSSGSASDVTGSESKTFEQVDVEVQFDYVDYSSVEARAGKKVNGVRAIYVPFEDINAEAISNYQKRLSRGNALLFDVKGKNGYLAWYSDSEIAFSYGLNMAAQSAKEDLKNILSALKEQKVYLVARICVLQDELLGAHCTTVNLRNEYGMYYTDEFGYWLDPYSTVVRKYTVDLVRELWDMGFDEVVLASVSHPVLESDNKDVPAPKVLYTMEMSTEPTPVGAVSSFAVYVSDQLEDRPAGKLLSIYVDSAAARVKADKANGQDGPLFMKLYDRVYIDTDMYAYQFNIEDMEPSVKIGDVHDRLVPVVINYLPDNTSWVLIDKEKES